MENPGLLGPAPTPAPVAQTPLSAQRWAVLDQVRNRAPVRVADIAAALGLHTNTIREHLEALVELGLVERTTAATGGRGRPAARYRPTATDPAVQGGAFAALATVLAGQLARVSPEPERDAESAGADWGRTLVEAGGASEPRRVVLDALARLGFAPDEQSDKAGGVALRRCPLLSAARRHPEIICRVHRGIVVGMLEELGAPADADLVAFAEPGACRLRLPVRA
ncbi:MarR family transcriptional regulator [Mycobacterium sp. 1274756.6]|uniref:helix-turn-helix transcriptional regulator n=1 Tax=Mycobacterium sp. 1274756.6 TaxID=1834076 RepID=UPI000800E22D|nr:MarR family transcriptional regulator [Mycobacterium sp. 1274756.6]OBJ72169.1 transcriptional regulator [Mycobacterium sp. 1274756.6]